MNLRDCWLEPIERIGIIALEAMLMEAACAPAPGLVDRFNSGAHQDMDIFTFLKSSSTLGPAMQRCALAGWEHIGPAEELLTALRNIGKNAEEAMFEATNGVNTQKGLLFLLGILTAAAARCVQQGYKGCIIEGTLQEASQICRGIVERELAVLNNTLPNRKLTAGEQLYLTFGITGIRGEIAAGLPVIKTKGLPCLNEALAASLSLNDALIHSLIGIMTETIDTTILNRHDMPTLVLVQKSARSILAAGGMLTESGRKQIEELDSEYSLKKISPGGSADMLAVTYFLYFLKQRM
ncbi:triphosphoribosyl-dephospho-CoA synthase CitG [Pelosinus sp. UFO1]|uniref:triphosphoribosyl-dephospho-CoA synthase CitG n=1 Tax=Pelosinus sp. UFO1 TaxID=484770 RepID=UPI0004D12CF5|nr:triphosphoribosyl-dephospho-CoA synthase CitG [Pelosinus sp. UFO1]AIF52550.1 2-(5''-triphosphoribosyl)-3'-dephosphocoenzyme-A synthase [Pelosinus sp. UFO1]